MALMLYELGPVLNNNIGLGKGPFTLGGIPAGYRAARYFTAGCCVYIRR